MRQAIAMVEAEMRMFTPDQSEYASRLPPLPKVCSPLVPRMLVPFLRLHECWVFEPTARPVRAPVWPTAQLMPATTTASICVASYTVLRAQHSWQCMHQARLVPHDECTRGTCARQCDNTPSSVRSRSCCNPPSSTRHSLCPSLSSQSLLDWELRVCLHACRDGASGIWSADDSTGHAQF